MKKRLLVALVLATGLLLSGCGTMPATPGASASDNLTGAWRSKVQFNSAIFSSIKDFEFMYVFNAGGTMTESSNYDALPPGMPAYGEWRKIGPRKYEAKYTVFTIKSPEAFAEVGKNGGWFSSGYAVLVEQITLADDGKTFKSVITYREFDQAGQPTKNNGDGTVSGMRMGF